MAEELAFRSRDAFLYDLLEPRTCPSATYNAVTINARQFIMISLLTLWDSEMWPAGHINDGVFYSETICSDF